MAEVGINKGEGCHFDAASSSFMCHISALMWLSGTLKKSSERKTNRREKERVR